MTEMLRSLTGVRDGLGNGREMWALHGEEARIHPSAIVHPSATLADDVVVGPYSVIGPDVSIGPGSWIGPHVVIGGVTSMGAENTIHQFSSLGAICQDKKYNGEPTRLCIGDRNTIFESCTFNRGVAVHGGVTSIGSDNWFMAYSHVAHDCVVGSDVIFANNASIAGHVEVGDHATIGGFSGVHQFVRIGAYAFIGGHTLLTQDLPPFVLASGNPAKPFGINKLKLQRCGFASNEILELSRAYRSIYRQSITLEVARERIVQRANELVDGSAAMSGMAGQLRMLSDFIGGSTRGIIR